MLLTLIFSSEQILLAQSLPLTVFHQYLYDPSGYLKESQEYLERPDGSRQRKNLTRYDQDSNEIYEENEQGTYSYTLFKDRQGRVIRRTGNGEEFLATDVAAPSVIASVAKQSLIRNFLLSHNRLPTKEEFDLEMGFIQDKGRYASRARLSLTEGGRWKAEGGSQTPAGNPDPSLVKNYGMSEKEETEITKRASVLAGEAKQSQDEESKLETRHLETLTQKTFRKFLGRDPKEEKGTVPDGDCPLIERPCSELRAVTEKLRSLNSQSLFEDFLKKSYNLSDGKTEHQRRREEIRGIINSVDQALRIYFGFSSGTLNPAHLTLLKLLKSDPAFEMRELSREDLDQIRTRLESLIEEDTHFGSSAASALAGLLAKYDLRITIYDLTAFALFSDILTGVVSREFIGNLQFSAYTLKLLAQSCGLKLTLDELKKLTDNGFPVLVSIEERHFVLVTRVTTDTVELIENGILRTRTRSEFQSRWFGVGLFKEDGIPHLDLSAFNLKLKTLSTQELLKVKGAGWFKKLFKKIKRFFQRIFQAVVKVLVKIRNALQKFLNTGFGKVVGFIFGGPLILAALNFTINSFSYLAQGDIKGLFKYWGQNALQIALMAASFALMFIPGLGQALAAGLKFLFQGLFAAVQFALGAAIQLLGTAISGIGSFIGNFAAGLGGFVRGAGSFLSQTGSRLMSQAQASLKEIFSNLKSAFSRVGESLKRSLGGYRPNAQPLPPHAGIEFSPFNLERIPAHPWITNHALGFVARESSKIIQKSLLERITDYVQKFSLQFLQQKIDQRLEKSKMNSFVKSLLSSFTSAALGAFANAAVSSFAQAAPSLTQTLGSAVSKGLNFLYQGGKAVLSTIGRGIQAVGRGIGNAFSGVKSFFSNIAQKIFGTRQPPVNANQLTRYSSSGGFALGDDFAGKITFGPDAFKLERIPSALAHGANGVPTELLQGNSRFILNPVSENLLRADLDAGGLAFVKPDSRFGGLSQIERIGNLNDTLFDLATQGPVGVGERIGRDNAHLFNQEGNGFINFTRGPYFDTPFDPNPTGGIVGQKFEIGLFEANFQQFDPIGNFLRIDRINKTGSLKLFGADAVARVNIPKYKSFEFGGKVYAIKTPLTAEYIFTDRFGIRIKAEATVGSLGLEFGIGRKKFKGGVHKGLGYTAEIEIFDPREDLT